MIKTKERIYRQLATTTKAILKCYVWTNPSTGSRVYYKQTSKNVICLNLGRNELSIKPKDWLLDVPQHREFVVNVGVWNERLKEFLKNVEV